VGDQTHGGSGEILDAPLSFAACMIERPISVLPAKKKMVEWQAREFDADTRIACHDDNTSHNVVSERRLEICRARPCGVVERS
jgi:hypothetical protein